MTKAVLLIFWKRLDTLEQTIGAIRSYRPSNLYISCDGGNSPLCWARITQVRESVEALIDWECTVHKRYDTESRG